jgi:hypothetical protein
MMTWSGFLLLGSHNSESLIMWSGFPSAQPLPSTKPVGSYPMDRIPLSKPLGSHNSDNLANYPTTIGLAHRTNHLGSSLINCACLFFPLFVPLVCQR